MQITHELLNDLKHHFQLVKQELDYDVVAFSLNERIFSKFPKTIVIKVPRQGNNYVYDVHKVCCKLRPIGRVAEWSKAAVLKTVSPKGDVGSNPTPSAIETKEIIWIVK